MAANDQGLPKAGNFRFLSLGYNRC